MALTDGLIAVYPMDGTWLDAFGTKHAAPVNTAFDTVNKKLGSAAGNFNGSNAYLDLPAMGLNNKNQPFTIAVWFRTIDKTKAQQYIVANGSAGIGNIGRYYVTNRLLGDKLSLAMGRSQASPAISITGTTPLLNNTYNLSLLDWDGVNTANLFLNDNLEGSDTKALPSPNSFDDWVVGGIGGTLKGNSTFLFKGQEDEIPFWNRVLTPSERTELWNGGNGFPYPFLVAAGRRRRMLLRGN